MHAIGKTPKGYGTSKGKSVARAKYPNKKGYVKTPNPGNLESTKMAAFVAEIQTMGFYPGKKKEAYSVSEYSGPLSYGKFKMESQIPPYRHPPVKTAGPPSSGKEKRAFIGLTGVAAGFYPGKNIAGEAAAATAPEGRVTRSENIARNLAIVGGPLGGLAGLAAAKKYNLAGHLGRAVGGHLGWEEMKALQQYGVPFGAGAMGSMAGGAVVGGGVGLAQRLRGPLHSKKEGGKEKKAYDPSPLKGPGTLGNVDIPGMRKMQTPARQLQDSKNVAYSKPTKPDASKALNIKLPTIGSAL
jgi:hypothetical protein